MAQVAFFQHPACGRHDTGWRHPEHQGRLRALAGAVAEALPELDGVEPVEGTLVDPDLLRHVHHPDHVTRVLRAVERAHERGRPVGLDVDTVVSGASWEAALAACGCIVDAVETVCRGVYRAAFCATRPPGHHATRDRAMGFCLFNGIAVGARHAVATGLADRVLIVDWDVHHGNGTQDIFYEDGRVFYLSLHQSPHYPGTGESEERGAGEGRGTTLNLPMAAGLEPDVYVEELLEGVDRALERFRPELVMISAGFDAARGDPLGGFTLGAEHFRTLTLELVRRTSPFASGRVVSVLEGGYNPEELGENAVAHLAALRDASRETGPGAAGPDASREPSTTSAGGASGKEKEKEDAGEPG